MMKTTLKAIRDNRPCADGWAKLLDTLGAKPDDEREVTLLEILDSNGPFDCLWAFRCVGGFDREKRLTACYMARCVLPIYEAEHPGDLRPRTAIETAERFASGQATADELAASWAASRAASWAALRAASLAASEAAMWAASLAASEAAMWAASEVASVAASWAASEPALWAASAAALHTYLRAMLTGATLPEPYEFWQSPEVGSA